MYVVCPALNTMANHIYMFGISVICRFFETHFDHSGMIIFSTRHVKNLSAMDIVRGLKVCYGLSTFYAMFLYCSLAIYFCGSSEGLISTNSESILLSNTMQASFTMIPRKAKHTHPMIEIDGCLVDALVSRKTQLSGNQRESRSHCEILDELRRCGEGSSSQRGGMQAGR